jgi:predicted regulator of Ras-like GTPase activity (Roadblock/LC7/MglB family)
MSFLAHLESVVSQVDGALACSVMGFDGIAVETHQAQGADLESLELSNTWVEFANVLTQVKAAAELLKTGAVSEVSINSEKVITLMRLVSPEYFLVLALKPTGNYGKGRYVLRLAAPKVKAEL